MNAPGAEEERRRTARNALGSYGARAATGLSALAVTPVLYRGLGAGAFGTWSVIFTITSSFTLFELGYSQGIAKFVAEHNALDESADVRATVRAGIVAFTLAGIAVACACLAVAQFGDALAAPPSRAAFRDGMFVIAAAVLIRFPLVAYGGALQGYQRYDLFYVSEIVLAATFAGGALAVVVLGGSVFALSVVWSVALVISAILYPVFLSRVAPQMVRGALARASGARRGLRLAAFSSITVVSESMNFIGQRMDTVVIAAIRDAAAAAPYAAAVKLQSGLQALTMPFVLLLVPMVSDLRARGEQREVVRRYALATRVTLQLTLPVAVALALFAPDAMRLWLGAHVPSTTFAIVAVLMAVQTITLTAFPSQTVLVGVGKVKPIGVLAVVEGFSNLGLSVALVSSYGAIGAALGSLFTSAALAPVRVPLACRAVGLRVHRLLLTAIVPAALSASPAIAAMVVVRVALGEGTVRLAIGLLAGLGIALAIAVGQLGRERIHELAVALISRRADASEAEAQAMIGGP